MKASDWKLFGQAMSKLQDLYAVARDTFTEMGVGVDIIPWLVGDGRGAFIGGLKALGMEFQKSERIRLTDDKNVIYVNLDAPSTLPFAGGEIVENAGGGWVRVEKRRNGLYVEGERVALYLHGGQRDGRVIGGHQLREALSGKSVEHPNLLDALLQFPNLVPEDWKHDELGRIRFIHFWAVIYRDADGNLYVRYLYFYDGVWRSNSYWLDDDWFGSYPAALRAS